MLEVHAPEGWKVQPASQVVNLIGKNSDRTYQFRSDQAGARSRDDTVCRQRLSFKGEHYDQGFSVVTREDLGAIYYYQPAAEDISLVDVAIPSKLAVGYIMGAGDDIPNVLKQIGINVKMITADELARGDLSRYRTIITGIRAYDVREDVRRNNARLLDFVHGGGTLIVQYNTGVADFNKGRYTPYPAELGRERVTEEQSPVQVLAPEDKIFRVPNEITADDFNGWIQERGLYFMHSWDEHWEPLLAMHDRGEPPRKGGLLRCYLRTRDLHLYRAVVLSATARRRAGGGAAVCEPGGRSPQRAKLGPQSARHERMNPADAARSEVRNLVGCSVNSDSEAQPR